MHHRGLGRVRLCVVVGIVVTGLAATLLAQDRLRVGQEVEVLVRGQWVEAEVLRLMPDGQSVQVRVREGGRPVVGVVPKTQLRVPEEKSSKTGGAEGTLRTWTDATGQFRIEAAFVGKEGEVIRLRKADGSEVRVPLSKLSRADAEYIAAAPSLPARPTTSPSAPTQGTASMPPDAAAIEEVVCQLDATTAVAVEKLAPPQNAPLDPAPSEAPPEGAVALRALENFESVVNFLPAQAETGKFFVAIAYNPPGKPGATHLITYDITKGAAQGQTTIPGVSRLAGGNAAWGWLLTTPKDQPTSVTIWKWPQGDAAPQPEYSVQLSTGNNDLFANQIVSVAPAAEGRIVIVTRGEKVLLWNITARRTEKCWESAQAAVSPGGRYLAIRAKGGIAVYDLADDKQLGYWSVGPMLVSGLAFSPSGVQVACQLTDDLKVFDLRSGKMRFSSTLPEGSVIPGVAPLWTSENHVLLGRDYLYDLDAGFVVWRYAPPRGANSEMESVQGRIAYMSRSFGRERGTMLRCVSLPHPAVQQALAGLDRTQLFGLAPGAEVALQVELTGADAEKTRAALAKIAASHQWKVNPNATARLVASVAAGEVEEGEYRDTVRFGAPATTIRVQTFISTLDVVIDGEKVWSHSAHTGLPTALIAPKGKSLQEAAAAYEKPNLEFFSEVELPERFVRPKYLLGLGQSKLTAAGIEGT